MYENKAGLTFIQLRKNCKKNSEGMVSKKLALMGDCATQHLATAIKGYAYEECINLETFDADYNQIDAQIIDTESELYRFCPDYVLIYMCVEKLYENYCLESEKESYAEKVFDRIIRYWNTINKNISVNILQMTFIEEDDRVFGNYAYKTRESFLYQVKKLNYMLMDAVTKYKNVFFVDLNYIQLQNGRQCVHDDKLYYIAKMPLSMEILPVVAKQVTDVIKSIMGSIKKCIILDLDNTLWGGVIGDDGMEGIQIGELGIGHAFSEFQSWLKEMKNRGIILAVCSKNNEDTAKEPFINHPEMVLRLEDIALFVANWEDKASNIRYIQKTINIGMDSIIFIDDNPFERNLVRSMIEGITVPELPEDPALYLSYLKNMNLFETASYSSEDNDRTKQYQAEVGRIELQRDFESFDDYLKGLEMVAEVKPFDKFHYARIAQLTQRSNQFNLRTIRYTDAQIEEIANDDRYITLYYLLKDKFGDHGLISVVIMEKMPDKSLFIDTWLMSCRVLKRGMEEFIINKVIETARDNGYKKVIGEYIRTPKNAMVEHIYSKMGFSYQDERTYVADVDRFTTLNSYIKTI